MSSRRSISNTFTVNTMDDPVSVEAQYSPDKSTIHSVWQDGDIYMRTRESDSSVWSDWHKMVGESGGETDYQFALSANLVTQDGTSATAPSDISSSDWQDAPMATTIQKPYLWSKVQKKDGNGNNVGNPRYARMTGEQGNDAVIYEIVPNVNVITLGDDETPIFDQVFFSLYRTEGSNNPTIYSTVQQWRSGLFKLYYVADGVQTEVDYDYMLLYDTKVNYHDIENLYGTNHEVTWVVKKSNSVIAQLSIGVVKNGEKGSKGDKGDKGEQGQIGKTGRFFYYANVWDASDNTHIYSTTDAEAPYFRVGENYYVYVGTDNWSNKTMAWINNNYGAPSGKNPNFQIMANDWKYIISQAIFTSFAMLGSAIFNKDWMISQYGTPSRTISAKEKQLVYDFVEVDGRYPVSTLATLLDDTELWDEYKGYDYEDSDIESVANVCIWAMSAMPNPITDDVRYAAIESIDNKSYSFFGVDSGNPFSVFDPNIALDFLRGKAYLNDCNVKGNLIGRVSTPFTRIKNSNWNDYGVQTTDDYGYTRHYLFINGMPTWNVQIEYMSGSTEMIRRLILPVITQETLGVEIKIVNVSGNTITVEGKPESSTYGNRGSYLLDGIQTTGYSNAKRTVVMDNQTMLKFVSVEIPTQYGEYGWIAIGEPQTIKSSN